jgi:hypothetical protein
VVDRGACQIALFCQLKKHFVGTPLDGATFHFQGAAHSLQPEIEVSSRPGLIE